jgi:hypothetical protein
MMTSATRKTRTVGTRKVALRIAVGAVALLTAATAGASSDANVQTPLTPTASAASARGKVKLKLKTGKPGRFVLSAGRLTPGHTFDVVVGGVKVGSFSTNGGGGGHMRFSTKPHGAESVLGFDPRGMSVSVRDAQDGDDDLVTDVPDDTPGDGACCLTNGDGETECEDIAADACVTAGGTVAASASCLPDPCAATPPSGSTVCCTNQTHDDESESECEDEISDADCAAAGGLVVQATSCDANPCQATPPANVFACCSAHSGGDGGGDESSHGGGLECEVRSADACAAEGGTTTAATSCTPDPCNAGSPSGAFIDGSLTF